MTSPSRPVTSPLLPVTTPPEQPLKIAAQPRLRTLVACRLREAIARHRFPPGSRLKERARDEEAADRLCVEHIQNASHAVMAMQSRISGQQEATPA